MDKPDNLEIELPVARAVQDVLVGGFIMVAVRKRVQSLLSEGPILWAVDPFEEDAKRLKPLWKTISLLNDEGFPLRPVSVVTPTYWNWPSEFPPGVQDKMCEVAKENLGQIFGSLEKKIHPTLLVEPQKSNRKSAQLVANYAKNNRMKLIALNSHGRSGVNRFRLGSFAEALIGISEVPVLIRGPHCKDPTRLKQVFFPTDLSKASRGVFISLVEWAMKKNLEIVLYHLEPNIPPLPLVAEPTWIYEVWEKGRQAAARQSTRWVHFAESKGVKCRKIMDESALGDLGSGIIQAIKKSKPDLVVMGVLCSPREQLFFGGNTREVLTASQAPVLVIRPK